MTRVSLEVKGLNDIILFKNRQLIIETCHEIFLCILILAIMFIKSSNKLTDAILQAYFEFLLKAWRYTGQVRHKIDNFDKMITL